MQIRCAHCTKTIALAATGALPTSCPHCAQVPGPGPLGLYEPVRMIAAGGMGEVYLARHRELGTEVAIKVLPAMPLDTIAAVRERFAREARLTAKVQHAGVVKVLGDDVAGDRPYLVLEFVAGQTLRERLRAGPVPVVEAARIAAATADVLAAAHAHGVLHRDIKPDNVMLEPNGDVRVLDFGIARAVQDDAPITRTGEIVGTPEYMAPEQLLDGPDAVTERTDVHALGVLLHELLTGQSPFHGANVFQALKLVESLVPPPPSRARPEVPEAIDALLANALAKQPADRTPTAAAFANAVRAAVPAARTTPTTRATPWLWFFWLPLAAALLIAAIAAVWFVNSIPTYVQTVGTAIGAVVDAQAQALAKVAQAQVWLRDGRWNEALAVTHDAAAGPSAQDVARDAFVLGHVTWPLAVDAPAWLAATDAALDARLFGDDRESGVPTSPLRRVWNDGIAGRSPFEPSAPGDTATPASRDAATRGWPALLRLHLTDQLGNWPPAVTPSKLLLAPSGDALQQLLGMRLREPAAVADALVAYAQQLPIEASERWLATMCAWHLRGDRAEGARAAEMAWLAGAGELAVLLDAYLQVAPLPGQSEWRPLVGQPLERVRRRVAGGDAADTPARTLLLAFFDALHDLELDTTALRTVPARWRPVAQRWFPAHANATPRTRVPMLRIATALGATPDYSQAPWSDVEPPQRAAIDAEVQRGR